MLMSKSRLEKFLYALYSLDSSDLPTPQSRIEELYKCLVTDEEAPTFEPISRVEKYLMAILGVYDVDSLPNPLSRVEVLLYKLATGDDNLDDVKSFLSEHEELLAEIIRNGGVGGNIDIEYVLHTLSTGYNTLYNTAEQPVKSAILKGDTLINAYTYSNSGDFYSLGGSVLDDGFIEVNADGSWKNIFPKLNTMTVKPNTIYTFIVEVKENTIVKTGNYIIEFGQTHSMNNHTYWQGAARLNYLPIGITKFTLTTKSDFSGIVTKPVADRAQLYNTCTSGKLVFRVMVVEGDLTSSEYENYKIPYFTGMKSVQMPVLTTTGFNLFDGVLANGSLGDSTGNIVAGNSPVHKHTKNFIRVDSNVNISIYYESDGHAGISKAYFYDKNKNYLNLNQDISSKSATSEIVTLPNDANICYMKIRFFSSNNNEVNPKNIIIAKTDNVITAYENYEYKSNILSTSEEVELRGVGDIKDELNLITGELTQRVGEVVLDGGVDEDFIIDKALTNTLRFYYKTELKGLSGADKFCISDKLPSIEGYSVDKEHISIDGENIWIFINKDKLTSNSVGAVRTYFESNPLTVQYKLATESVKTIDISTVNQDGNNTKLSTFNDITHVTLSSEGPIPEAELEVATKNEEVLNTMSLEMDDIYAAQTTLEETSNTQSENVDATMIATTEIYEGLL